MRALRLMLLLITCAFATGAAAEYPDKPIRLIVPQAAGSATDTVARILGAELGKELAQQIVIDNRPGGALTIGLDLTAKPSPTDTRSFVIDRFDGGDGCEKPAPDGHFLHVDRFCAGS